MKQVKRKAETWIKVTTFRCLLVLCCLAMGLPLQAQTPEQWKSLEANINFFIANDLGRNGYYDQKIIAERMGEMADAIGP